MGARCPVTPVDNMISGYDYDYDYIYMYIYMYTYITTPLSLNLANKQATTSKQQQASNKHFSSPF